MMSGLIPRVPTQASGLAHERGSVLGSSTTTMQPMIFRDAGNR